MAATRRNGFILDALLLTRKKRAGGVIATALASLFIAATAMAAPSGVPQASLTVACGIAAACNADNTSWELEKEGSLTDPTVTWTVTVTKGSVSNAILTFNGSLTVTNTGSAPGTIGNIVVNLQRVVGKKWKTVASDVADATSNDAATTAKICSGASSEGKSSFTEGLGSGPLQFTDASNNSVFSLVPKVSLAPGQPITLDYSAKFDNTLLGIPEGELVRVEAIVTFGNAGARGGSGAVCTNMDIDGSGGPSADEANVRSVPCRTTLAVPALEHSNATVSLSDTASDIAATGTVTFDNFSTDIGSGTGVELLSDSATRTVSVDVDGGADGGTITNTAYLVADPEPSACSGDPAVDLQASDTQTIGGSGLESGGFLPGDYCTCGKGDYGSGGGTCSRILKNNFGSFITTLTIGVNDGLGPLHHATWTDVGAFVSGGPNATCTGLICYMHDQTGTPGGLTADTSNATSTGGGVLPAQVVAMTLNIGFSGNTVTYPEGQSSTTFAWPAGFGDLMLCNTGGSLDGSTLTQVLTALNNAIAGNGLPQGYAFSGPDPATSLEALVDKLNHAFDSPTECEPSSWAQEHLCK